LKPVDLRSDTVTQPTAGMRAAMLAAPLGDDVFGDDPTVNALQAELAALLGFEAGLFMPSGTQSNLCALMTHCQRGDEYLVGHLAHCYRWEAGGAAVLGSIQPQPLPHQPDGTLSLTDIEAAIKPDDPHFARTRLLALENTLGGRVMPLAYLEQACALAASRGLARHLDGARLFNAAVAMSGDPMANARAICKPFDSVSVCFSKGLGTPVGSVLCASREAIARARRWRKMTGGAMRQTGLLAAAARYALEHHIHRLSDDHRLAQQLAAGLGEFLKIETPQTNIVFADGAPDGLVDHLTAQGVLVTGLHRLRFVTHLDIDEAAIDRATAAVRSFFKT
jgi:threonine aldolase